MTPSPDVLGRVAGRIETGVAGSPGLATAAEAAAALAAELPPTLVPLFTASFIHSAALYDEFVHRLTLRVFREAGLDAAAREPGTAEEITARAGLEAGRASIPIDWALRALRARRVLADAGRAGPSARYRLDGALPDLDAAIVRDEQRRHDPSWLPSYVLAETVAGDYPAFLRGETTGEAILFSPTRLRLWVDYFSNENGLYAVNNRLGAIAVDAWLPGADAAILELGGGLASGAIALLERLEAAGRLGEVRRYRFTEIAPAFLARGERALRARFPEAAFLSFERLDMNRPFAEQGVEAASFSVVYAVNTLHVAHDLDATLAEIFRALVPGGRLIVSECIRPLPGQAMYAEFVFNLMETFRSPRLHLRYRPNGGFLTPEQWTAAVEAAGFADVQLLPDITRIRDRFPVFYVGAIGATRPA